jgi:hypothetical protein
MKFYFYYGRPEIAIHIESQGILLTLCREANKFPGEEKNWKEGNKFGCMK